MEIDTRKGDNNNHTMNNINISHQMQPDQQIKVETIPEQQDGSGDATKNNADEEDYQILDFDSDSSSSSSANLKNEQSQTPLELEIERIIKDAVEAKMEAVRVDDTLISEEQPQESDIEDHLQLVENRVEHEEEEEEKNEKIDSSIPAEPIIHQQNTKMMDRLFNIGRDLVLPVGVFSLASYLTLLFSEGV